MNADKTRNAYPRSSALIGGPNVFFGANPLGDPMSNPLSYLHDQLEQWRAEGTYQRLRILETASAAEARFDGKEVINLASNNYLGLTTHPKLREAALGAIRKFGVGSGAVRTIAGTMSIHMQLDRKSVV